MWLMLKQKHIKEFLVPCYDMDLIWHTHQVHPHQYCQDTNQIFGMILPHDDSVNDRSDGSKLNNSYASTVEMWRNEYVTEFSKPGAMFRGNPPSGKLGKIQKSDLDDLSFSKKAEVHMKNLTLPRIPEIMDNHDVFVDVKVNTIDPKTKKELGTVFMVQDHPWIIDSGDLEINTLGQLELSNVSTNQLMINIKKSSSSGCMSKLMSVKILAQGEMIMPFESDTKLTQKCTLHPNKEELGNNQWANNQELRASFELSYNQIELGTPLTFSLGILPGTFYDTIMPETVESIWGPVPLKKLEEGKDNNCKAVSHK